jgi:hypothetical protein
MKRAHHVACTSIVHIQRAQHACAQHDGSTLAVTSTATNTLDVHTAAGADKRGRREDDKSTSTRRHDTTREIWGIALRMHGKLFPKHLCPAWACVLSERR